MLILAGITIATLFGDNGIINKAQKAKDETKKSSKNELDVLNSLEGEMKNIINGTGNGGGSEEGTYDKAEVDKKVDKPSTIDGNKPRYIAVL